MRHEGDRGMGDMGGPPPSRREGLSGKWIGVIVAAILLVVFAVQNSERVDVDFLVFDTKARVVTVIVVAAALGFAIGWLVGRPSKAERKAMKRGAD